MDGVAMTRCAHCLAAATGPLVQGKPMCTRHKLERARAALASREMRDPYAEYVGGRLGEVTVVESKREGERPVFVLKCDRGHVTMRRAWQVVRMGERRCSECAGHRTRAVIESQPTAEPEVCNCTYYGGRLLRACNRHAKVGT